MECNLIKKNLNSLKEITYLIVYTLHFFLKKCLEKNPQCLVCEIKLYTLIMLYFFFLAFPIEICWRQGSYMPPNTKHLELHNKKWLIKMKSTIKQLKSFCIHWLWIYNIINFEDKIDNVELYLDIKFLNGCM